MSAQSNSLLSRVRQPEYTGENRCTPCAITNVAIAIITTIVIAVFVPWLALAVFGLSLAAIYLRGYLVPGTPKLTKRYFPDRVLRWFDKAPSQTDATLVGATDEVEEFDPEPVLLESAVLEFTPDETDLRLTNEFQTEWNEQIEAVRDGVYEPRLARMLSADEDVDPDALDVEIDDHSVTVLRQDNPVAIWVSEAALIADVAAIPLLEDRLPEWETMGLGVRSQLLHGIRVFSERCPTCGSDLTLSEETVESCCRTAEVATLNCNDCESRVLEVEV